MEAQLTKLSEGRRGAVLRNQPRASLLLAARVGLDGTPNVADARCPEPAPRRTTIWCSHRSSRRCAMPPMRGTSSSAFNDFVRTAWPSAISTESPTGERVFADASFLGAGTLDAMQLNLADSGESAGRITGEGENYRGRAMKYVIKLYVTGQTPRSQQAIANLRFRGRAGGDVRLGGHRRARTTAIGRG